jgi:hypothetical protein
MKKAEPRLGALPPRYRFFLNPYREYRFTRCPICEQRTRWRKFALVIHIDPRILLGLNMHGRFCPTCELLIIHQDQLEAQLAISMTKLDPSVIGNDYLVIGTLEREAWREGMQNPKPVAQMLEYAADFREVVTFEVKPAGWYREE